MRLAICLNGRMALEDNWMANLRALIDAHAPGKNKAPAYRMIETATGLGYQYIYQLYTGKSGKTGMGKDAARSIARAFANGRPESWFDLPPNEGPSNPRVAHALSDPQQIVSLRTLAKETWMTASELPDEFQLVLIDDALGDPYEIGSIVRFSRLRKPTPRKPVLIEDREGNRLVRLYVVGRGSNWLADAATSGYETLESERDGLRVLAVATGYSWPEPT